MLGDSEDEVRHVTGDFAELKSTSLYWGGSDDRSSLGTRIVDVVDRNGRTLAVSGITEDWTVVAPGITARREGENSMLRISRAACPVRVKVNHYSTYESYTDWDHQSFSASDRLVRYEAHE